MAKKTILALLLVVFSGALIWGGVNRTLAKSGENEGNSTVNTGNGNQGWSADHNPEDREGNDCQDGESLNPVDASGHDQSDGNGQRNGANGNGGTSEYIPSYLLKRTAAPDDTHPAL